MRLKYQILVKKLSQAQIFQLIVKLVIAMTAKNERNKRITQDQMKGKNKKKRASLLLYFTVQFSR